MVLLVLVPVGISLFTRAWSVVAAVLLLAALVLLGWSMPMLAEFRAGLLLHTGALMAFFIGQGYLDRRERIRRGEIAARLVELESRIESFCEALDARSQNLDREAIEIAKRRIRAEVE